MWQSNNRKKVNALLSAACVFGVAVGSYLLSFSAVPISDDEQLYASAARNLAVNGRLSAEQLYGNSRLRGSYHGVEPAFPALASIWYRAFLPTGFGHLQSLYLLPVLLTGLSAGLIVIIAYQLGFSNITGVTAGLFYGLSSMAWPYAKTLFREPLTVLLLLAGFSAFLFVTNAEHPVRRRVPSAVAMVVLLVLLTLTKVIMGVAAIALLITYPLIEPTFKANRKRAGVFVFASVAALAGIGALLASSHGTDADIFYRFTGAFVRDALGRLTSIPHSHLTEALVAPLISPWKGLLFYSPVCTLGIAACWKNMRSRPGLFILPAMVLISTLLSQALAYDAEWWTPTWGSRFLLPAIPLLIVAALPLIEEWIRLGRTGWIRLAGLFGLGFMIQLPAVIFNSAEYSASTYQKGSPAFPEQLIWNLARTPVIMQWQAAASQQPDLLLWRVAQMQPGLAAAAAVLAMVLIAAAVILLVRCIKNDAISKRSAVGFAVLGAAAISMAAAAVLGAGLYDPAYQTRALDPLCTFIGANVKPSEVLIVQPYPGPLWDYLMNTECGQKVWYSLPYNTEGTGNQTPNELASDLTAQKIPAGAHVWVIEQNWSGSAQPATGPLAPSKYQLVSEKYLYNPFLVFIGSYAPKP
jgi:hypothetical protein